MSPFWALYWTALDTSDLWCCRGCNSSAAKNWKRHYQLGRSAARFHTSASKGKTAKIGPRTWITTETINNSRKCRNHVCYLKGVQAKECAMNTFRKIPFAVMKRRPKAIHLTRSAAGGPGSRIQKCVEYHWLLAIWESVHHGSHMTQK